MLLYQKIAQIFSAYLNCIESNSVEWQDKHQERLEKIIENCLPYGSGFDTGTKLDYSRSNPNKLVFDTEFHHMNENGYYDGWTQHKVTIKPNLQFGYHMNITGINKDNIKDYISDVFSNCFDSEINEDDHII